MTTTSKTTTMAAAATAEVRVVRGSRERRLALATSERVSTQSRCLIQKIKKQCMKNDRRAKVLC